MFDDDDSATVILRTDGLSFAAQINEFEEFMEKLQTQTINWLTTNALDGFLRNCEIRSVIWKVFLGILKADVSPLGQNEGVNDDIENHEWKKTISKERKRYEHLKEKHFIDPRKLEKEDDLVNNNPLADNSSSAWSQYFRDTELEKTIIQDLNRLYPEHAFFRTASVQSVLKHVLFVWSKENEDTSYRQGMHELLAILVLVLHREARLASEFFTTTLKAKHIKLLSVLIDSQYLEHDAYLLFEKLMRRMKDYFMIVEKPRTQTKSVSLFQVQSKSLFAGAEEALYGRNAPPETTKEGEDDPLTNTPLYRICNRIQNLLLKYKDPELHSYLTSLGIEPQLYGLRWIRLLFGREFHLEDVAVIWDAIFADGFMQRQTQDDPNFIFDMSLVEHIAVMMLIFIRSHMLQQDYSLCLRRLMKYPPVENVHMFVSRAIESRKKPSSKFDFNQTVITKTASTASLSVSTPPEQSKQNTSNHQKTGSGSLPTGKDFSDPLGATKTNSVTTPSKNTNSTTTTISSSSSSSVSSSIGRKMKFTPLASMLSGGFASSSEHKNVTKKSSSNSLQDKQRRDMLQKPKSLTREELISREEKLGESMHQLLGIIQNELFEKQKGEYNEDTVVVAISKLKHIKDVLRYQLTLDDNESKWVFDPNYLPVEVKPKTQQDIKAHRKSVEIPTTLLPTVSDTLSSSEQQLISGGVFPSSRELTMEDNTVSTEVLPEEVSPIVDSPDVNNMPHHDLIRPPVILDESSTVISDDPLQSSSVSADFQEVNI